MNKKGLILKLFFGCIDQVFSPTENIYWIIVTREENNI